MKGVPIACATSQYIEDAVKDTKKYINLVEESTEEEKLATEKNESCLSRQQCRKSFPNSSSLKLACLLVFALAVNIYLVL